MIVDYLYLSKNCWFHEIAEILLGIASNNTNGYLENHNGVRTMHRNVTLTYENLRKLTGYASTSHLLSKFRD